MSIRKQLQTIEKKELLVVSVIIVITVLVYMSNFIISLVYQDTAHPLLGLYSLSKWDMSVYYSMIEQVKQGSFFVHNLFTSEPQGVGLFHPLWLLLGWIARVFNIASLEVFHWSRFVMGVLVLYAAYAFSFLFFKQSVWRLVYVVGLGWFGGWGYLFLLGQPAFIWHSPDALGVIPIDVWYPDAFIFLALNHSPLFLLALLLLLIAWCLLLFPKKYSAWLVAVLVVLLGLIHPYDIPIFWSVAIAWLGLTWFFNKQKTLQVAKLLIASAVGTLGVIAYYGFVLLHDITISGWFERNLTLPPGVMPLIWGMGLLLPLAIVGVISLFKRYSKTNPPDYVLFVIAWGLVLPLIIYTPASFARRMMLSFGFVVVLLAVIGLQFVWDHIGSKLYTKNNSLMTVVIVILVIISIIASVVRIALNTQESLRHNSPVYAPIYYYDIMRATKNTEPDAIILTTSRMGNVLPGISIRRVFIGHGHQTVRYDDKEFWVKYLYNPGWDGKKDDFIAAHDIDYVIWQQSRRAEVPESWNVVYQNPEYILYKL